jgi:hypothetical protein
VHTKKHLSFTALRNMLSEQFRKIDDPRQAGKVEFELHDCLMSAFAMMLFQDPSLSAFQRRLEEVYQRNNLQTMFAVGEIPKESQLRELLDEIAPSWLEPIFSTFLGRMQRAKQLELYRVLGYRYLVPIDGSEYFSSKNICCPGCLTQKKGRKVRYHHNIVQAVIAHPDMRQVLPLAPEQVTNRDGTEKQDCEINAAKRLLIKLRKAHPKLPFIIGGDGLYSKQPFITACKAQNMSFVLVAKPTDHKVLFEHVEEITAMGQAGTLQLNDSKKRRHLYRWVNQVPINGREKADDVNFFHYQLVVKGKVTYQNSWVTDIPVDTDNIVELVKAGRCRWKIENETFNTLKNQGYHIEHNFGHGTKHLSMIFFILNLLAFSVHQILELTDRYYHRLRYEKFTSRKEFWNQLRCTFRILLFQNWEHMFIYLLDPPPMMPPLKMPP